MENIIGKKFGALTVLEFGYISEDGKKYFWKVRCDCGKERLAASGWFKRNNPSGCNRKCTLWKEKPRKKAQIISKNKFYFEDCCVVGVTTRGQKFYFDIEDFEKVSGHTWSLDGKGYLITVINKKRTYLHHFVLGIDNNNQIVDHRNGKPENCQKENLRPCSHVDNTRNCKKPKNNTSGYKGVTKSGSRWRAFIKVNYKQINLGTCGSKIEAAQKYNEAALKYFGEFALLNEIEKQAS